MAKLTAEQKVYFAAMEQTFNTEGWGLMSRGWKEEQDQLPERMFFGANTIEDMQNSRVRYGLLNELLSLPETIAAQKEAALAGELDGPSEDV